MITYHFKSVKDETLLVLPESRPGVWVDAVNPTPEEVLGLTRDFGLDTTILNDALDFFEVPRFERAGNAAYFFTRYLLDGDDEHADTAPILIVVGESFVLTLVIAAAPFLESFRSGLQPVVTTQKTKLFLEFMKAIADEYGIELNRIRRSVNRARVDLRKIRNRNIERLVEYENALNDIANALVPTNAWLKQVLTGNYLQLFKEDIALVEDLTIANNQLVDSATSILKASQNIRSAHESILTNNLNTAIRMLAAFTIILTIPMTVSSMYGMNVKLPFGESPFAFWYILGFIGLFMGAVWRYFSRKRWL
jgi:magnesium transporter